jgi:hypothetical protein
MIPDFGSWYRTLQIEPNDDRLQRRWAGIEKAAKACDLPAVLDLARLFNGFAACRDGWLADFKKRFQEEDSAFNSDSASAELVVLAGATIAQILATNGKVANAAAMASQVAAFGLAPERRRVPAIRAVIDHHLIDRGTSARAALARRPPSKDRGKKIEALVSGLQNGHQQAAEPARAILIDLAAQLDDNDERLLRSESIRQESSGVLWWLMGAYSETMRVPFSEATRGALPVVCAYELAQLTRMFPALPNSRAFLLQAFGGSPLESQTVVGWIRAVDRSVRRTILDAAVVSNVTPLLPVLDAMRKSLDLANDEIWAADAVHRFPTANCSAIECAEQTLRELLLCKHIESDR